MIVPHVSSHLICIVADTAAAGGHPAPTQLAVDYVVRIHVCVCVCATLSLIATRFQSTLPSESELCDTRGLALAAALKIWSVRQRRLSSCRDSHPLQPHNQ